MKSANKSDKGITIIKNQRTIIGLLLITPLFAVIISTVLLPIIWLLAMSLTDKTIGGPTHFIGFENYWSLFKDGIYLQSLRNTALFVGLSTILQLFIGIIIALLFFLASKYGKVLRSLVLLPWIVPTSISALIWLWMLYDIKGIINYVLQSINVLSFPVPWLGHPDLALASLIAVNIWHGAPFVFLTTISGLENVPQNVFEVAALDGANYRRQLFGVALPYVWPTILATALLLVIWNLGEFQMIHLLTRGGPGNSTQTIATLTYELAFKGGIRLGQAIAVSISTIPIVMILIMFISSLIQKLEK